MTLSKVMEWKESVKLIPFLDWAIVGLLVLINNNFGIENLLYCL